MCRLDVDWERVRARLTAIAARAGVPLHGERGVLAILERARASGLDAAVDEMEAALGAAELDGAARCDVNDGLLEWLALESPEAELSVLSLNCPEAVGRALVRAGLHRRVRWVLGRGDTRPKPDPQGLELLLGRHSCGPHEALFVGDSAVDRACALAARVRFRDVADLGARWRRPGAAAA